MDYLPHYGILPVLTPEEVGRYVELGETGHERLRNGDDEGAARAFRGQIAIFPPNPAPYVSLAILEAGRGDRGAAMDNLREAVIRGFIDLRSIELAEAWSGMNRTQDFLLLQEATSLIVETEREWVDWDSFRVSRTPDALAEVLEGYRALDARLDMMAPALGERLTRLWRRVALRAAAFLLEAWIGAHPDAPDLQVAVGRLMSLYANGPLLEWKRVPPDAAGRLLAASNVLLGRFPDSESRPTALVARAMARNAWRDADGRLLADAERDVRKALDEVVANDGDSAVYPTAVVGLLLTDVDTGRMEQAATRYRRFRADRVDDPAVLERVQEGLGDLALRLGGLPDFSAPTLDGGSLEAEALRGRVTVIDFWATWCPPCIEGFSTLRRIEQRYPDEVRLVGINLDRAEDLPLEGLREWVAGREVPGRQLWDGRSWDSEVVRAFGVREIPFTVVVGSNGEILAVNEHGKRLQKAVQAVVRQSTRDRAGAVGGASGPPSEK